MLYILCRFDLIPGYRLITKCDRGGAAAAKMFHEGPYRESEFTREVRRTYVAFV